MTPQLQQAIRLLQLPSLDLQAHVRETLETNVMLEGEEETGGRRIRRASAKSCRYGSMRNMPNWMASARRADQRETPGSGNRR